MAVCKGGKQMSSTFAWSSFSLYIILQMKDASVPLYGITAYCQSKDVSWAWLFVL